MNVHYFSLLLVISFSLGAMKKDEELLIQLVEKPIDTLVFHPDNQRIAITGPQLNNIYLIGGEKDQFLKDNEDGIRAFAFHAKGVIHANGMYVATLCNQSEVPYTEPFTAYKIWDIDTFAMVKKRQSATQDNCSSPVYAATIAFNLDGSCILYATDYFEYTTDCENIIMDAHYMLNVEHIKTSKIDKFELAAAITQLTYSPIYDMGIVGLETGMIELCDIESKKYFSLTDEHISGAVRSLSLNADNTQLVSIHEGSPSCAIWDVTKHELLSTDKEIIAAKFHPVNPHLFAVIQAKKKKTISLFNTECKKVICKLSAPYPIEAFDFSPDGSQLAVAGARFKKRKSLKSKYTKKEIGGYVCRFNIEYEGDLVS